MNADDQDDPNAGLATRLAAAMKSLPEMMEKKRSIDMHTNIAMALMSEVKARKIDKYYEMENQFSSQSVSTSIKAMDELLSDSQKGTLLDKTRALMCLYLSKPSIEPAKLQGLIEALGNAGGDTDGMAYFQHLASIRSMSMAGLQANTGPSAQNASSGAGLMGFMKGMQSASETMLDKGMKGLK